MLEVVALQKSFDGKPAVSGVSFQVQAGECFGLLGPNGAGKSTTIAMIAGLLKPDSGDARVDGHSVVREPMAVKAALGVIPQDIALYPTLSARENLRFWGRMYGLSGAEAARRTEEVLEIAGLTDRGNERIDHYSGGMKRRINIAAGLMHRPKLLIMDEPTVGIDPQSRNHILETVQRLNREGMTVLYTSHYMEEVEQLCERLAIMDHGQGIAQGTKAELSRLVGNASVLRFNTTPLSEATLAAVRALHGVASANAHAELLEVVASDGTAVLAPVSALLVEAGVHVRSVSVQEPNLESVFLHLTGRALRDE